MLGFFSSTRRESTSGTRKVANRGLRFEGLEGRTLMSATPLASGPAIQISDLEYEGLSPQETTELRGLAAMGDVAASRGMTPPNARVDRGTLIIHGCKGDDNVIVKTNNQGKVTLTHYVNRVLAKDANGKQVYEKPFSSVREIVFLAYDGANQFHNTTSVPSKVLGGKDIDIFEGNKYGGNDVFFGLGGDDKLYGLGGSDRLYGGQGADRLEAGQASEHGTKNILKGGRHNDVLIGSGGLDLMYGNSGNDRLLDEAGGGKLYGGKGDDTLCGIDAAGSKPKLEMHGGPGKDKLIVKDHIYAWHLWDGDDYTDGAISGRANKLPVVKPNVITDLFRA